MSFIHVSLCGIFCISFLILFSMHDMITVKHAQMSVRHYLRRVRKSLPITIATAPTPNMTSMATTPSPMVMSMPSPSPVPSALLAKPEKRFTTLKVYGIWFPFKTDDQCPVQCVEEKNVKDVKKVKNMKTMKSTVEGK